MNLYIIKTEDYVRVSYYSESEKDVDFFLVKAETEKEAIEKFAKEYPNKGFCSIKICID
jgi:hypothetical protein